MDEFKRELYAFSGFSTEQKEEWTLIANIDDCIRALLDDTEMMRADNQYTFAERSLLARARLFELLFNLATADDNKEYLLQLTELRKLIGCAVEPRPTQR